MIRLIVSLTCLSLCFGLHSAASADDLQEQARLSALSKEAARSGDYGQAIVLMKSAIALGELNILYLNLGRLYFKAGQCEESLEAYARALIAPQAPSPPAPPSDAVKAAVERYRSELIEGCPAQLTVECKEEGIDVFVGAVSLKCGATISLEPGKHVVKAARGGSAQEVEVTLSAMQRVTVPVSMGIEAPAVPQPEAPAQFSEERSQGRSNAFTWALGGVGGASLIAGVGVSLVIRRGFEELEVISNTENGSVARYDELVDQISRQRVVCGVLLGIGGAMVLTAGGLAVWGGDSGVEEVPGTTFNISPSQGGWVFTFEGSY